MINMKTGKIFATILASLVIAGCSADLKDTKDVEVEKVEVVEKAEKNNKEMEDNYMTDYRALMVEFKGHEDNIEALMNSVTNPKQIKEKEFIDNLEKEFNGMESVRDELREDKDIPKKYEEVHDTTVEMAELYVMGGREVVSSLRGESDKDSGYIKQAKEKIAEINILLDEIIEEM